MPIAASVTGTLTRVAAGGSAALGTLSVIGYAVDGALGTLEVDRTLFLAFYARVRLTRPDVYLDDELMANLVDTVSLDSSLDDPIDYATFTLSDKRVAFFDAATVSNGERAVQIDFWAGPPGGVKKWVAFYGNTEASHNAMPYRPRGTFKAVSLAAKWADRQGCLNVAAFSELTRGQIIAAFAQSAGVVISNAANLGGGIVRKALDIAGKTPFQLIQEYGEAEGWFARANTDLTGLEIISEDQMMEGAPIFAFDESNTFDVPESTPDRPVTDWILSTTQVVIPTDSAAESATFDVDGVDEAGNPTRRRETSTMQYGVEIEHISEDWATIATPGIDSPAPTFQIVNRVTIRNTWAPFTYVGADNVTHTLFSTMLTARKTTTETLTGVPTPDSVGYEWVQGGWYYDWVARLMITEEILESFTWGLNCAPVSSWWQIWRYYAPLGNDADSHLYSGTMRNDGALVRYTWRVVEEGFTAWGENDPNQQGGRSTRGMIGRTIVSKFFVTGHAPSPDEAIEIETYKQVNISTEGAAPFAQPTSGSASQPQFSQQVLMAEFDVTTASGYTKITSAPGLMDYPESIDELYAIARRRVRRAFADTLDIPHTGVPYLRPGDHVSVTNHARSLVDADAYVYAIKRTANVLNGAMRQVTTVKIPPSWI